MQGKTISGFDKLVNFTEVIVSTGYDASATSVVLQVGEGARLPDPAIYGSYYGIWHDVTAQTLASGDANREWILINTISSDTITSLTRAQQETAASTKNELGHQYRISIVLSAAQMEKYNTLQNVGISRQAVLNSNFNIWGAGTSFADPVNASATSDKWNVGLVNTTGTFPTLTHSKQTLTSGDVLGSFYNYRINANGAGTSLAATENYRLYQDIINATRFLAGVSKKITVSFYAKSSIGSKKIGINVIQNYGTGGSPTADEIITGDNITLTSTWTFYSFTYTLNTLIGKTFGTNNDDYLRVQLWTMWQSGTQADVGASSTESFGGSGNVEFAQIQVCSGDVALDYKAKAKSYEYSEVYGVSLFDGSDVSTHYHSLDRARANHTGTQSSQTLVETGTAGETLSVGHYIYKKSSDSKLYKADKRTTVNADAWNVIGVVTVGGNNGDTISYHPLVGEYTTSGLTAGATYYLGDGGVLSTTNISISSTTDIPVIVAVAKDSTTLVFKVQRLQRFITHTQGSYPASFTVTTGWAAAYYITFSSSNTNTGYSNVSFNSVYSISNFGGSASGSGSYSAGVYTFALAIAGNMGSSDTKFIFYEQM